MDTETAIEKHSEPRRDFVLGTLNREIERFDKKVGRLKLYAYGFKISVMALGMISTVLLGLNVDVANYLQWSRNIAFVIGAAVTFLTGLESYWNIQAYRIENKIMLSQLSELKEQFRFLDSKSGGIDEDEILKIFEQYLSIVRKKSEYWKEALTKTKEIDSPKKKQVVYCNKRPNSSLNQSASRVAFIREACHLSCCVLPRLADKRQHTNSGVRSIVLLAVS